MSIICGAIDLGGTKIEARLFGEGMETVERRRTSTPVSDFDAFIEGLAEQIGWLATESGRSDLPVGIATAGIIQPETGIAFASNIPVSGRNVREALEHRFGRTFPIANDCMALAYSEAHGGAGGGIGKVIGLIIGTGVGAGVCVDGKMPKRHTGLAIEVGHVGMPARILEGYGLPVWPCGCGNRGCMERYMSAAALGTLAEWKSGHRVEGPELVQRAASGDEFSNEIINIWTDLVAECLLTLQLITDPACIVIGGGASKMPGLVERLEAALGDRQLGESGLPELRIARHGDSSGARGMGLLALAQGT